MKHRLFLLIAVLVLITTPAVAGRADVSNVDGFGAPMSGQTLTDDGQSPLGFRFRLTVQVHSMDETDSGGAATGNTIYTYVYQVWHNSGFPLVLTTIHDMEFNSTLDTGSVGTNFLQADPDFTLGKLRFQFDAAANWDDNGTPGFDDDTFNDPLIVYAQSYLPPVTGIISAGEIAFGGEDDAAFANTLGPGDPGTGSGLDPVPEPATLLLLTSGLLSGGYLRFKKRKEN